jgi:hypothetical protein
LNFGLLDTELWNGELNREKFFFFYLGTLLINVPFLFFFLGTSPGLELRTGMGIEQVEGWGEEFSFSFFDLGTLLTFPFFFFLGTSPELGLRT